MSTAVTTTDNEMPFTLILPTTTFVAGGIIAGHFELDLKKAQALALTKVYVQLRGNANT
jgi:hypothetical protein